MLTSIKAPKQSEPDFSLDKQIIANLRLSSLASATIDPEMSRYFSGFATTKEYLLERKRRDANTQKFSRRDLRKLKKMRFRPNFNNDTDDADSIEID